MKVKQTKAVKRIFNTAIVPVNMGIKTVNILLQIAPVIWVFLKFVASRPKWLLTQRKMIQQVGKYRCVDGKGRVCVMLLIDEVIQSALNDPAAHGSKQAVLDQIKAQKAEGHCPEGFAVPDSIYLLKHPTKGLKFERIGDAWRDERREYSRPVRDGLRSTIATYTGL